MWKIDDARAPTNTERQHLTRLMYLAFCDLRALAKDGRAEQAKDLAEAFHNVPLLMNTSNFSFKMFWRLLEHYQQKYEGTAYFNYLREWEKLNPTAQ